MTVENISGWGWLVKKCNETIGNWWNAFSGSQAAGQERQFTSGRTAGYSNPHHLDLCDFIIFIVTNSERNMNRAGCKWKWAGFSIERIVCGVLAGTHGRGSIWHQPCITTSLVRLATWNNNRNIFSQAREALLKKWHFKSVIWRGKIQSCQLSIFTVKLVRGLSFFPENLNISRCQVTQESYTYSWKSYFWVLWLRRICYPPLPNSCRKWKSPWVHFLKSSDLRQFEVLGFLYVFVKTVSCECWAYSCK